ncbi:MAG: helix-turn-helix transcriptional regulator [Lysobacter sp.]|nr:helix-turn-helix transcriptional regulator [Lysobacter sp.]
MSRRTPLWSTPDFGAYRFDHAPDEHDHGDIDEIGERYSASFVERGAFDVEIDDRRWRLGPGDVLLISPGLRFRVSHLAGDLSDVCLSVAYTADAIDGSDRSDAWTRASAPVLRADNRLRYLHWSLRRAFDRYMPLLAETCAIDLFREVPHPREETAIPQPRVFDRHAERIHAVRECIDRRYAEDWRLHELAALAHMSVFHFARLFAEFVGRSPHRYLADARLSAAAAMLRDGRSVTDACYACGFGDPSHFSRAFAQRYGRTPSAYAQHPH